MYKAVYNKFRCIILLLGISILPWVPFPVHAFEVGSQKIDATLDFTYATQYMWHGYDMYPDDHGAFQPSVKFEWNGFYTTLWGSWADESGFTNASELDYIVGWNKTFWEDNYYALSLNTWWNYFDYYNDHTGLESQEIALSLSLPNLIPLGPSKLVPHYTLYYDFDAFDAAKTLKDGFFHEFGLDYAIPIPALIPDQKEQAISLGWQVTYEDDVYVGVKSGFSHTTASISTTFEWKGFYFTPAVKYQWSLEDTMNPENELYGLFSIGYSF